MVGQQVVHFRRGGDHLHRVHPLEWPAGLEGYDLSLGQRPPRAGRPFRLGQPVLLEPRLFGRGGGLVVDGGGKMPALDGKRHVVDVVLTPPGRLENQLAELAVDFDASHVRHAVARLGVDHPDVFLLRLGIASSPGNPHPHGVGRPVHADSGAVVAPAGVPRLFRHAVGDRVCPGDKTHNPDQ